MQVILLDTLDFYCAFNFYDVWANIGKIVGLCAWKTVLAKPHFVISQIHAIRTTHLCDAISLYDYFLGGSVDFGLIVCNVFVEERYNKGLLKYRIWVILANHFRTPKVYTINIVKKADLRLIKYVWKNIILHHTP